MTGVDVSLKQSCFALSQAQPSVDYFTQSPSASNCVQVHSFDVVNTLILIPMSIDNMSIDFI